VKRRYVAAILDVGVRQRDEDDGVLERLGFDIGRNGNRVRHGALSAKRDGTGAPSPSARIGR
jgi:hypothetical protein